MTAGRMIEVRMRTTTLISLTLAMTVVITSCEKQNETTQGQVATQIPQAKPFRGEVYTSLDGRTVITIVSADELEIAENGVNAISKYGRQDSNIRAVVNTPGMTQAVYYQVRADGLQDAQGRRFYTPAGLQAARQQALADAERAAEQDRIRAREEAENRVRLEALQQESIKRTRTISTFDAYIDYYGDNRFQSGDLTDVDVLGKFALGGIRDIKRANRENRGAPWGVYFWYSVSRHGRAQELVCFKDEQTQNRFVTELDGAIRKWHAKYEPVAVSDYLGIVQ